MLDSTSAVRQALQFMHSLTGWYMTSASTPRTVLTDQPLVTEHHLSLPSNPGEPVSGAPVTFWVLYGHLSLQSIEHLEKGQSFVRGEQLAALGVEEENGGWPPHVHVQMSLEPPQECDLPGVVESSQRQKALDLYPDPRLICGPLY